MREQFFDDGILDLCSFVTGVQLLLQSVASLLQRCQVCERQLGINDLDVADRINRRADVMNVRIFETTNHLHNRVHFANVMEELIAQALARACAFHQSSDIDELDRGRRDFF